MKIKYVIAVLSFCWMIFLALNIYEGIKSRKFAMVEGVIAQSFLQKVEGKKGRFRLSTEYNYSLGDVLYTNDVVSVGNILMSEDEGKKKLAHFKKGSTVNVYYNPENPEESMLITGGSWIIYTLFAIATVLFVVSVFSIIKVKRLQ